MWAIGANMNDAMDKAAYIALTTPCSQNLAAIAGCHIPKFSFRNVNHFSHKKLKISKKNSFILT
jgi:hypothetical protein